MGSPAHPYVQGPLVPRETLQRSETPFFGLGTNMANINHGSFGAGVVPPGVTYIKRDHRNFQETMERLHAVGGNYLRMYLLEKIFSPEYVNLGVYDQYRSQPACANGNAPSFRGNCQYQCWAFDQMIDCARASNIYLQVCVDAYPPGINFESLGWGANAYWLAFIEPNPLPPPQRFNMRKFFYTYGEGHPDRYTKGVFYYWKRKYKYMMSRWGWSVNIAALEPFNEIDQLLTYRTDTIDGNCNENDGAWAADAQLPDTISAWFGDMARFVRGTQDPEHPARSPLGENKLFLASYAMNDPGMPAAESFYAPLTNPEVDLIDAHLGLYPDLQAERDLTDERIHQGFRNATAFWNRFPAAQSDWHGAAIPMPFIIGETSFSAEDSNDDNFDDPFNHHLVDDPAHDYPPWRDGPESQQSAYASQTMTATRAYLGSGYSWWGFQNGRAANLTPPSPPTPSNIQHWQGVYRANFYGALKYGDENANPPIPWEDKLVAGTFSTYSLASAPSSLPTPPADYHRGKFNGSLSSGTVLGTVNLIDQDGQAITHAVGWTKLIYSDASNDPVHEIVTNQISNDQGLLNIHRGPVINGWYVSKYEMRVHVPGGATSPGDASNQSYQSWQQLGSSLTLARSKLAFTAEASGVTVPIGQSYDPKAWSTLFVNNVTYEGNGSQGASGDLRARQFIHMSTEFHAAHGSEVHIHPENVFPDCGDPHMLVAEDNPHINHESAKRATDSAHQLVLRFKDFPACGLRVAPNPCGEFLEVSGLPPGAPYRIVSDQGAIVLTGIITVQPIRIQVSAISPGHYTLHAEFENTTCSAPFVKMN
ncbi:MAG: hypothetical protein QY325_08800 [Flavobacteriales bacterium]|nr:MAG: hypothetical protein QY325_08800 [Flavobacteriales bacterium]